MNDIYLRSFFQVLLAAALGAYAFAVYELWKSSKKNDKSANRK